MYSRHHPGAHQSTSWGLTKAAHSYTASGTTAASPDFRGIGMFMWALSTAVMSDCLTSCDVLTICWSRVPHDVWGMHQWRYKGVKLCFIQVQSAWTLWLMQGTSSGCTRQSHAVKTYRDIHSCSACEVCTEGSFAYTSIARLMVLGFEQVVLYTRVSPRHKQSLQWLSRRSDKLSREATELSWAQIKQNIIICGGLPTSSSIV